MLSCLIPLHLLFSLVLFFFFLCCAPFGRGYRVEQKGYSVLHLATMRNQGAMGEDSVGVDARADLMAVVRTPTLP